MITQGALRIRLHSTRGTSLCLWLVGLLIMSIVASAQMGAVQLNASDWLAIIELDAPSAPSGGSYVLWHIRIPRAVFAALIGGSLGLAGALTQGLFRNPLADPGLLGVSAGAACAAALTIVVVASVDLPIPPHWRIWLLPTVAFSGALAVCFTLDWVARWITPGSLSGLLLTGIALNALAAAVIGLCTYLATDEQLRNLSFWTLGSLAGATWSLNGLLVVLLALAAWSIKKQGQAMNALALGEATAAHIGVNVRQLRGRVITWVAVLAGFSVAWCGMIGFIGLIAPHLVRIGVGADQRLVIPMAAFTGGVLLVCADTFSRTVAIPAEIPVGVFTALLGSPFFLFLLKSARGRVA